MSGLFAVVVLVMVSPGSSWGGPSYYIQDVQHFATVEHCEAALKTYSEFATKAKFNCIEGVVPRMNGGR
jgi:hypothetical protein